MRKSLGNFVFNKKRQAQDYVESWQSTVYSLVVFGATMVVIFWASVFLYTSFYFTFMPQESITWPIHFQYKSCGSEPGICSNPQAVIPVLDPKRGSLLVQGQKYRVVVDLEMPESPVNQRLGMFLLNMEMKNQDGDTLRHSFRSSMLRYKSELLRIISTSVFAPLLLYGLQEEKQVVTVELFSQYEEDPLVPLYEVHVELASRHVELYSGQLRIHAMFSGLRYFMFNYPLSAAAVGIGICMVFLATVVILSWYQFSEPTLSPVQASRNMVTYPNGSAPSYTAVNTKVEEEESDGAKDGEKAEEDLPKDQEVKVSRSSSSSSSSSVEVTRESPVGGKSEREDFEMVGGSRGQKGSQEDEKAAPVSDTEGESVLRQRVQSVL